MAKLNVEMNYTLTLTGAELRLVVFALRGAELSDAEEKQAAALAAEVDSVRMWKHKEALGQSAPQGEGDERPKPIKKKT